MYPVDLLNCARCRGNEALRTAAGIVLFVLTKCHQNKTHCSIIALTQTQPLRCVAGVKKSAEEEKRKTCQDIFRCNTTFKILWDNFDNHTNCNLYMTVPRLQ